jgi:hypothetical protein
MIGLDWLLAALFGAHFLFELPLKRFQYFVPLGQTYLSITLLVFGVLAAWLVVVFIQWFRGRSIHRTGTWLAVAFLLVTVILGTVLQMGIRSRATAPEQVIHDGAVQTESALAFLFDGKNPYAADYRATPFGNLIDVFSQGAVENPAWDHYVYPPGYLLASAPFYAAFSAFGGFYDQRIVHLAALALLLGLLAFGVRKERRVLALVLFAVNPAFLWFFLTGYNDAVVIAALLAAAVLWKRKRILWTFALLGIAVTLKQSAILFLPAFAFALVWTDRKKLGRAALAFLLPVLLIALPFFVSAPADTVNDLLVYPSHGGPGSYPISGFGLSSILLAAGVIHGDRDVYPMWIFQLLAALPLLAAMWFVLRNRRSVSVILTLSTVLAAAVWYTSRYFNDSHIVFLLEMMVLAYVLADAEETRMEGGAHA